MSRSTVPVDVLSAAHLERFVELVGADDELGVTGRFLTLELGVVSGRDRFRIVLTEGKVSSATAATTLSAAPWCSPVRRRTGTASVRAPTAGFQRRCRSAWSGRPRHLLDFGSAAPCSSAASRRSLASCGSCSLPVLHCQESCPVAKLEPISRCVPSDRIEQHRAADLLEEAGSGTPLLSAHRGRRLSAVAPRALRRRILLALPGHFLDLPWHGRSAPPEGWWRSQSPAHGRALRRRRASYGRRCTSLRPSR